MNNEEELFYQMTFMLTLYIKIRDVYKTAHDLRQFSDFDTVNRDLGKTSFAYLFGKHLYNMFKLQPKDREMLHKLCKHLKAEEDTPTTFCQSDEVRKILDEPDVKKFLKKCCNELTPAQHNKMLTVINLFCQKNGASTIFNLIKATTRYDKKGNLICPMSDKFREKMYAKLLSVFRSREELLLLKELNCMCFSCKTSVADVICKHCKYMTVCSACVEENHNDNNNDDDEDLIEVMECGNCNKRLDNDKVHFGFDKDSANKEKRDEHYKNVKQMYTGSVRFMNNIQDSTGEFHLKHNKFGLISSTNSFDKNVNVVDDIVAATAADPSSSSNNDDDENNSEESSTAAIKPFNSFVNTQENDVMKNLNHFENILVQNKSHGIRLCDHCKYGPALKKLKIVFTEKDDNDDKNADYLCVCISCYQTLPAAAAATAASEEKQDASEEEQEEKKEEKKDKEQKRQKPRLVPAGDLFNGMQLPTATYSQLDLLKYPISNRNLLEKKSREKNADALQSKYKLNSNNKKGVENETTNLKYILNQIKLQGLPSEPMTKDNFYDLYYKHTGRSMMRCWPSFAANKLKIVVRNTNTTTVTPVDPEDYAKVLKGHELSSLERQIKDTCDEMENPGVKTCMNAFRSHDNKQNDKQKSLLKMLKCSKISVYNKKLILVEDLILPELEHLIDENKIVGYYKGQFHRCVSKQQQQQQQQRKRKESKQKSTAPSSSCSSSTDNNNDEDEEEEEEEEEEISSPKKKMKMSSSSSLPSSKKPVISDESSDAEQDEEEKPPLTPGRHFDDDNDDETQRAVKELINNSN